ncbi:hypothetical protein CI102_12615 [Trichoderma harzianum]|uniref:Uncharacterized protein n=1 Tax=Trichoderma harzianum CBS 226.95 TaxID=983964 RepID=A0A2T4AQQ3_TRIHA|nr:hypothetical protein M431DRAFT_301864 [Trichoderma harzianum CBS 226.95]PKK44366.1 hypothetical protein CI102_12615 [Trichoderma harzianum]PTB59370.1 hypothetical protein M431DRAFT_301864 [Trichoderma harzianum CBS 226.95]
MVRHSVLSINKSAYWCMESNGNPSPIHRQLCLEGEGLGNLASSFCSLGYSTRRLLLWPVSFVAFIAFELLEFE